MSRRAMAIGVLLATACASGRPGQSKTPPSTAAASTVSIASGTADSSPGAVEAGLAAPGSAEPTPPEPTDPDVAMESLRAKLPPPLFEPGGPSMEITRRVRTGVQPKSIAMSPSGDRLYVCNFGLAGRRNVWVYETAGLQKVGRIDFPGNAAEATVSADGATVYVSNFARARIEVVDAKSLKVTDEIKVGNNPKFMVVDEERGLLYVSNWSSHSVSAVDLSRKRVDHTLWTGRRPRGLALLDDGTLLVGAMWDHRIQVYAPGSTKPDREFDACENPRHLMLSPDQSRLYVSCSGDRVLRWFDPLTGEVLGESPTGRNPRTIDVSPDGRFVAVADFSSSTVSLVDLVDMHYQTHEAERTKQIVGLAVAPEDELRIFVTSWLTNELLELRPAKAPIAALR